VARQGSTQSRGTGRTLHPPILETSAHGGTLTLALASESLRGEGRGSLSSTSIHAMVVTRQFMTLRRNMARFLRPLRQRVAAVGGTCTSMLTISHSHPCLMLSAMVLTSRPREG
jgi:hypothetical protein